MKPGKAQHAPTRYRAFLWRIAVPVLSISVIGLLCVDYIVGAARGASVSARLVANGFVAGVAANLFSALIALAFVDRISRRIESEAQAHERTRWNRVREVLDNRVRGFATGHLSAFRPLLGVHAPMSFFDGLPNDTAGMQIGATHRTADLLKPQLPQLVTGLGREQWRGLAQALRDLQDHVRRVQDHSRWLGPDQLRMLLDLEDQAQSILNLYVVVPEIFGRPEEIDRQFIADTSLMAVRTGWYQDIILCLRQIMETLEELVESRCDS